MARKSAFEAEVMTHLKYIREHQEKFDEKIDKIISDRNKQSLLCDKRFDKVENDVSRTKGMALGAMGIGGGGGVLGFLARFFQ